MESNLGEIIRDSLAKIKELAGVETIIGEPIATANGTTVIPICKVWLGFVSGGLDLNGNGGTNGNGNGSGNGAAKPQKTKFGGGGGTGVTVSPIGFLVINASGEVNMLNITQPEQKESVNIVDSISSLIEKSPEIIKKLRDSFGFSDDSADESEKE